MVVLGHYADHRCCISAPSIALIMACTAFSERAVRAALRSLEADRLIERCVRTGYLGETLPAAYYLTFAEPMPRVIPLAGQEHRT